MEVSAANKGGRTDVANEGEKTDGGTGIAQLTR